MRSSRWMCVASDVDLRRERGAGLGASGEGPQSTSGAARGTASARTKRRAGYGARRADAPFDRPADHGIADQTQRVHGGPRRGSALDARAGVIARPRSRAGKKETLGRRTALGRGPNLSPVVLVVGMRVRITFARAFRSRETRDYFSGGRAAPFAVRPLLHDRSRRRRVRVDRPPHPPPPSPALLITACLPSWRPASAARIA